MSRRITRNAVVKSVAPKGMGAPWHPLQGFPDAFVPSSENLDPARLLKPGMYDPALDWQGQGESLGFRQLYGQNTDPSNTDTYNPGSAYNISGQRTHDTVFGGQGSYVDPTTGQRTDYSTPGGLAELMQSKDRGQQDYNTSTQGVQRNYRNLGLQQAGSARAAGVSGGGSLQQAMQKRAENQGIQQGALDTNWRRFVENNDLSRNKFLQGAGQQQDDLTTSLGNATQNKALFGHQLDSAKVQSAQQMGTLPEMPAPGDLSAYHMNRAFGTGLAQAYANPATKRGTPKFFKPRGV